MHTTQLFWALYPHTHTHTQKKTLLGNTCWWITFNLFGLLVNDVMGWWWVWVPHLSKNLGPKSKFISPIKIETHNIDTSPVPHLLESSVQWCRFIDTLFLISKEDVIIYFQKYIFFTVQIVAFILGDIIGNVDSTIIRCCLPIKVNIFYIFNP